MKNLAWAVSLAALLAAPFAEASLLSSSRKLAQYPGEIAEKSGWKCVREEKGKVVYVPFEGYYESKGGRIESPKFDLDKKPDENAWYEFEFSAKCEEDGYWWVDVYNAKGEAMPDMNSKLYASKDWKSYSVIVSAQPGTVAAKLAFVTTKGVKARNVVFRRVDVHEAAEWCRKLYATLPQVEPKVPADAWAKAPKSAAALRDDKPIRILFLGDSIVNDTWCGNVSALIREMFPKAHLMLSVRGSTGCWYYQEKAHFEEYVSAYKPDLVLIGGVSNRKRNDTDAEAIASVVSVIEQCRAKGYEAIFMSPAPSYQFRKSVEDPSWDYETSGLGSLRRAWQLEVVKKTGVGYWDLTTAPCNAMANSKKPLDFFRRDFVHNDDRGKQLIAQTLLAYFKAVPEKKFVTVENAALRMTFDGYRVREIFDKTRNVSIAKAARGVHPLLGLKVKAPGGFAPTEDISALSAEVKDPVIAGTKEEPVLKLEYTFPNGIVAKPQAKLTKKGHIEWTIEVVGAKGVEICELDFPRLGGFAIAGEAKDDCLYYGSHWRQMLVNNYRRGVSKAITAMRFQILWDEHAAVYIGIEDPDQNDWWFWDGTDGNDRSQLGVNQHPRINAGETWNGRTKKVGGESRWREEGTIWRLAITDGGTWHKAAQIAREYDKTHLKQPEIPPYLKWLADGWVYPGSNNFPYDGWEVLNNLVADRWSDRTYGTNFNWYADLPIAAGNRQMIDGPCGAYCGRYPGLSLVWGSEREFREKREISKAHGEFYEPYINANLYSPAYTRSRRIGAFAKALLPDDNPTPDEAWLDAIEMVNYDGVPYAHYNHLDGSDVRNSQFEEFPCGMMTRGWRSWLDYWFDMYARKDWSDGIYIDQYNFVYENGRASADYPDQYGAWLKASRDWLLGVKANARKYNPYTVYSGECANEITAQAIDIAMTSAVFDHHNVYRYVLPWAIVFDGKWNGGKVANKYRFNWLCGVRYGEGMGPYRNYVDLQKRVKSFLYDAEFRDAEDLVCRRDGVEVKERFDLKARGDIKYPLNTGILAKWNFFDQSKSEFAKPGDAGRGAVVNVINANDETKKDKSGRVSVVKTTPWKNVTVTVPTAEIGEVKAAYAFLLDGTTSRLSPRVSRPGFVEIPVPESEASSIILSNGKLRPLVQWEHNPVLTRGAKGTVKLKVTNVNDEPMKVSVKLRLPKGWQMGDATACRVNEDGSIHFQRGEDTASPMTRQAAASPFALQPGETRDIDVAYVVADDAPLGRHDLWADVKGEVVRQETGDKNGLGLETGDANSSTFSAYNFAVVNKPYLMDFRGGRGNFRVWFKNLTEKPITGSLTACGLTSGLDCKPAQEEVTIPAKSIVEIPCEVTGADDLVEFGDVEATFRTSGWWIFGEKESRVRRVMPLVANRDFEIDHAGDRKPDWWMCRANFGDWAYECMNLTTDAHSGKYALELKPANGFTKNIGACPTGFGGRVGATYEISFWSKADKDAHASVRLAEKSILVPPSEDWVQTVATQTVKSVNWTWFGVRTNNGRLVIDDIRVVETEPAE